MGEPTQESTNHRVRDGFYPVTPMHNSQKRGGDTSDVFRAGKLQSLQGQYDPIYQGGASGFFLHGNGFRIALADLCLLGCLALGPCD